ncbi:MAG: hypothetical protein ACR2PL_05500 [Dehalococcoidia bacterium]
MPDWRELADRVVGCLGVRTGELIQIRDNSVPSPARDAWIRAVHRLVEVEDERRLPFLLVNGTLIVEAGRLCP